MANLIRVKVFPVGQKPYWQTMENKLVEFQNLVGGWIEPIMLPHKDDEPAIVLLVNEEGKIIGLPGNLILADREGVTAFERRSDVLCGTVVACRTVDTMEGAEFDTLHEEDIPLLCRWIGKRGALE